MPNMIIIVIVNHVHTYLMTHKYQVSLLGMYYPYLAIQNSIKYILLASTYN